jgi:hypothetical protein
MIGYSADAQNRKNRLPLPDFFPTTAKIPFPDAYFNKLLASIVGLTPSLYDAATGTPVDMLSVVTAGGTGFSSELCILADSLEQMAKLLPSDGAN